MYWDSYIYNIPGEIKYLLSIRIFIEISYLIGNDLYHK